MKNCSNLVALHMGHNNLFGPIPDWVGENPKQLAILVLRSNHFNASVPTSLCRLQSLQLLDLSLNHISGTLPKCLSNLTKMVVHEQNPSASISYSIAGKSHGIDEAFSPDDEIIDVVWKGKVTEFRSTLKLVKSIDLSSNMLNGEVPTEITLLVGLVSLNLSRNNLMGQIPLRIGNLANLDSLDLSNNHLSGSIPQSLGLIHGISVLNVSNNNLSGKIPKGTQLQSFNASAYVGNPELCGDPLPNSCPGEETTHRSPPRFSEKEEDGASNREETNTIFGGEFYASMVIGYAVGFLGVVGTILFSRSCRFAYFKVLQDVANWAYVVAAIHKAKFVRRIGG
ncbi:unnamed protein product [Cuscuta epithymum]|uniref:Uncharacterized protein n=2 Tax=Cuscuta epithymum TaxID=186058 RepID=A0AAV0EFB5_9ASTE|nr:unnamed protein product [Cuscuta epithymum]